MAESSRITVLGLGNILLGDEGFGVHFARWFSGRYRLPDSVSCLDGGTLGYGLLDIVSSCDCLMVIDVIRADGDPGSLFRFTCDEMQRRRPPAASAHEVEFFDVLTKAEMMDERPETVFLCIVPQRIGEMLTEMTPVMHERFPDMERLLLRELAERGVRPERTSGA